MWDHVYGGLTEDDLTDIVATPDGGALMGGWSYSGIGGNRTAPHVGSPDYWIVKIDSLGNKQWDKAYGGPAGNFLYSIVLTSDEGYLLTGYSNADSGENKSENNLGQQQVWMVKTDSAGNQQWDKNHVYR